MWNVSHVKRFVFFKRLKYLTAVLPNTDFQDIRFIDRKLLNLWNVLHVKRFIFFKRLKYLTAVLPNTDFQDNRLVITKPCQNDYSDRFKTILRIANSVCF